ncbi:MAG TPA: LysM peptidoglycan-binding domain-containing protein [Gemmatimonadales bacterium]|nr:LysM peptidoglycan-binding domain-containing protein [Gemmatimonadales bacterium]
MASVLTACAGRSHPVATAPRDSVRTAREAGSTVAAAAAVPSTAPDSVRPPPPDSLLPVAEVAAELRSAVDSAADAEVLEQLDSATAAGDDSGEVSTGGTNAVEAVTWDIDVATFTNHDRVQYFLNFFQGPARERFTVWLSRMPRYESLIRQSLAEQGLPGDLIYLALIESGFSNTAVSRARATGMWQFMRGTARMYGLRVDSWVDERRDPYRATWAAVRHLRDLRDRFGSVYLAAAAYNAGGGKVSRGLSRLPEEEDDSLNSDATFFRLADTRHLRQETRDYVPKLIAAALIAKEPGRYGFPSFGDSIHVEPLTWDSLLVPDATGLDVVARLADTTVTFIRELNPMYLRLATPPGSRSIIRIPAGSGDKVRAAYAVLPPGKRVSFREHFVTRGETLGHIAQRYHMSVSELREANPRISTKLRIGQRLIIPTSGVVVAREAAAAEDRRAEIHRSVTSTHTVRSGETLSEIAEHYHLSVTQLKSLNGLRSNTIRAGQRLRVRASSAAPSTTSNRVATTSTTRSSTSTSGYHVVRPGDTISGVAARYGVTQAALRTANGLGSSSVIKAGTRLKIPG